MKDSKSHQEQHVLVKSRGGPTYLNSPNVGKI